MGYPFELGYQLGILNSAGDHKNERTRGTLIGYFIVASLCILTKCYIIRISLNNVI